jgi:hypothetical protein
MPTICGRRCRARRRDQAHRDAGRRAPHTIGTIASSPAYSPCAPEFGRRRDPSRHVAQPFGRRTNDSPRPSAGANGDANSGQVSGPGSRSASMAQEPSGIIARSSARSRSQLAHIAQQLGPAGRGTDGEEGASLPVRGEASRARPDIRRTACAEPRHILDEAGVRSRPRMPSRYRCAD